MVKIFFARDDREICALTVEISSCDSKLEATPPTVRVLFKVVLHADVEVLNEITVEPLLYGWLHYRKPQFHVHERG